MAEYTQESPVMETQSEPRQSGFGWGSMALLGAIIFAAVIVGLQLAARNQGRPLEGPAPDFNFTTFDGVEYNLSDFEGKVVLINFWASWCAPCAVEAPELQAAWERYEDSGDVVFLGIAYADNGPGSLGFIDKYGLTYLNAPDVGTVISEEYDIEGVPETFIIDKNGDVAEFIYAGVYEAQLVPIIDRLLAGS